MLNNSDSDIINKLIKICENKKCEDIRQYNLTGNSILSDYFLVLSVKNKIHCRSVLNDLKKNVNRGKVSGSIESEWVILDLGTVIVHIITEKLRTYYKLDSIFERRAVVYHS
ncbi:ribosome silencing factor [Candidatus Margulisiibacteriota bacterium]